MKGYVVEESKCAVCLQHGVITGQKLVKILFQPVVIYGWG